jgi:iron-sulfur cluster repair protein YtfE (RIC family)
MTNDQNDMLALGVRDGLPDALRVLVREFPKTGWQSHPNFGQMVQFWLQRHAMFRQLLEVLESDVQAVMDKQIDMDAYAPRLSRFGGMLLNGLHEHHHIEDDHYFPRLVKLDARIEQGFELLEADHQAMDGLLQTMASGANAVLQGGELGVFLGHLDEFGRMLNLHLTDEEEIIVPVILKTGFDG